MLGVVEHSYEVLFDPDADVQRLTVQGEYKLRSFQFKMIHHIISTNLSK